VPSVYGLKPALPRLLQAILLRLRVWHLNANHLSLVNPDERVGEAGQREPLASSPHNTGAIHRALMAGRTPADQKRKVTPVPT
jgi:hypothetical protein